MPRPTVQQVLDIAGRRITIATPCHPEQILSDAIQAEEDGVPGHDPYWGLIWDAAYGTAEAILRRDWPRRLNVLELGCGVGLSGVAALLAGLEVTFSDLVADAVDLAVANAADNGFPAARGMVLDWSEPPPLKFELLLASDVLYDQQNHAPLLNVMDHILLPEGQVWIGDAGRYNAVRFVQAATAAGWHVRLEDQTGNQLPALRNAQFQLLVLHRTTSPA